MLGMHANGKTRLTARFHAAGVLYSGASTWDAAVVSCGRVHWCHREQNRWVSWNVRFNARRGKTRPRPCARSPMPYRSRDKRVRALQMPRRSAGKETGIAMSAMCASALSNDRTLCGQACRWLAAGQPGCVNQTASSNPGSEIAGNHSRRRISLRYYAVQRPASNVHCPSSAFPFPFPQPDHVAVLCISSLHFIPHFSFNKMLRAALAAL
jgi:hypothetical protein